MILTALEKLDNITFGEWLALWYETYKKPLLKPYSLRNIEQIIRLHTPDWLKALPLKNISVLQVDFALSSVNGMRTRLYTRQVWNSAFLKAFKLDLVPRNIIEQTEPIKHRKKHGKTLTIDEQQAFIHSLDGKPIKWLMLFYLYSGVRRAEALSLRWEDINYSQNLILIRGTKTADSYRQIFLTDDLRRILDGQRSFSKDSPLVFPYSLAYASQAFKKLCPLHHLHDLRHTYITRCAESGVNVSVCQQLVGHSTPQLTISVYTHVLDDFKRREASKFKINPFI